MISAEKYQEFYNLFSFLYHAILELEFDEDIVNSHHLFAFEDVMQILVENLV